MLLLQVAAGLFAVVMLARHIPLALRALRDREEVREGRVFVHIVNVVLALAILVAAILAVAVKGLGGNLISK